MKRISAYLRSAGRGVRSATILTAAVVLLAFTSTAHAASLSVTVKQVSPDGKAETVTCALLQKDCDISLMLNEGTPEQQPVNVHVVYTHGGLVLHFQAAGGYFSTADTVRDMTVYNVLWNRRIPGNAPATFTTTLFEPLAPTPFTPLSPSADYTPVADLEVRATTSP